MALFQWLIPARLTTNICGLTEKSKHLYRPFYTSSVLLYRPKRKQGIIKERLQEEKIQNSEQTKEHTNIYGYTGITTDNQEEKNNLSFSKQNKHEPGLLNIPFIELPWELRKALERYYEGRPLEQMRRDGERLHKHLLNRGRPTEKTKSKYHEQYKSGKKTKNYNELADHDREAEAVLFENKISREDIELEYEPEEEEGERSLEDVLLESKRSIQEEKRHVQQQSSSQPPPKRRPLDEHYSVITYGEREVAAYASSQIPLVYGATLRALKEIKKRVPEYAPRTIMDFGSGTGMTVWAGHNLWSDSIREYQCIDTSSAMNSLAEFLIRGGSARSRDPLLIPGVFFKKFLPLSNQLRYDIVVSAFSITELPYKKQRMQAIQSLWNKTTDFLVLVETGNNEGFDALLMARRYITEDLRNATQSNDAASDFFLHFGNEEAELPAGGHIFAPCPHEEICARSFVETRDHPCVFQQRVELALAQKEHRKLKGMGFYDTKYSFLVLRKGEKDQDTDQKSSETAAWARVLKPVVKRKKHVICELCCANGNIEKHIFSKRMEDKQIYKGARHVVAGGDMIPLELAKRPMNIRKAIPPSDCDTKNTTEPGEIEEEEDEELNMDYIDTIDDFRTEEHEGSVVEK